MLRGIGKLSDSFTKMVGGRLLEYKLVRPAWLNVSYLLHAVCINGKREEKAISAPWFGQVFRINVVFYKTAWQSVRKSGMIH